MHIKNTDIPSLQHYSSLLSGCMNFNGVWVNKLGMVQSNNPDAISAVAWGENNFCLMPGPEFSSLLFRGENRVYETSKSSLQRVESPSERYYWVLKGFELKWYLESLPAIRNLQNLEFFGRKFIFSHEVISQHYGGKTNIMDFSRSEDVAMFFATTEFDHKLKKYIPLKCGKAVLYKMDLAKYIDSGKMLMPLGFHFFPRPTAQKAFGVYTSPNDDLANGNIAHIEKNIFEFDDKVSFKYYEMFEEGKLIYPDSPFDDFFYNFMNNKKIKKIMVMDMIEKNFVQGLSFEEFKNDLKNLDIKIVDEDLETPSYDMMLKSLSMQNNIKLFMDNNLISRKISPHYQGD